MGLVFVSIDCFVLLPSAPVIPLSARRWAKPPPVFASPAAANGAPSSQRRSQSSRMMAGALDETKGVSVGLGDYKDGSITVEMPRMEISDAQVEAALAASKKPYRLIPVRFVEEGGTKMGHTVIMDWEAKVNGELVHGAKKENFELELKEGHTDPWNTFSSKIAVGMGQMETKVFPVLFPNDFEIEGLRGKEALVQAVVKSIARRESRPPETRSDDELRVLLRQKGEATMQSRMDQAVDEAVKKALLASCKVDADKVLNAVSWAKFGEKSTLEFKWNCIKEKIASEEGIEPREVTALLRREANVVFSKKK
ncbi:unnamed protein product [Ascophyllum nodosum]